MMENERIFVHQSEMQGEVQEVWDFHASPGAFQRLAMPPMIARVHRDERTSLTDGEVEFTLWLGPIPIRWKAVHMPGPSDFSFIDRMDSGPLAVWEHTHLMEKIPSGVRLTDRIKFRHKTGMTGWFTRLLFDGLPLRLLFIYRHWRTRKDVLGKQVRNKQETNNHSSTHMV